MNRITRIFGLGKTQQVWFDSCDLDLLFSFFRFSQGAAERDSSRQRTESPSCQHVYLSRHVKLLRADQKLSRAPSCSCLGMFDCPLFRNSAPKLAFVGSITGSPPKNRMVEKIKRLDPKLDLIPFTDSSVLGQS